MTDSVPTISKTICSDPLFAAGIYLYSDGTYLAGTDNVSVIRQTLSDSRQWLKEQIGEDRYNGLIDREGD